MAAFVPSCVHRLPENSRQNGEPVRALPHAPSMCATVPGEARARTFPMIRRMKSTRSRRRNVPCPRVGPLQAPMGEAARPVDSDECREAEQAGEDYQAPLGVSICNAWAQSFLQNLPCAPKIALGFPGPSPRLASGPGIPAPALSQASLPPTSFRSPSPSLYLVGSYGIKIRLWAQSSAHRPRSERPRGRRCRCRRSGRGRSPRATPASAPAP